MACAMMGVAIVAIEGNLHSYPTRRLWHNHASFRAPLLFLFVWPHIAPARHAATGRRRGEHGIHWTPTNERTWNVL